tara:strand:- start:175 stop:372 length:198 start_codon:yes stop_codon:yes gene_type:complete
MFHLFIDLFIIAKNQMYYFFSVLSKLNKIFLPKLSKKHITKLSTIEKIILGYKYWVTKKYLKYKK